MPIPSREFIMQILEEFGRPMSQTRLLDALQIKAKKKQEALSFRLKAMLRDGQIMQDRRGRYCLLARINLKRGSVQGHPDGYGFFIPDDGSPDMILSAVEMRALMHGDIVLAYQSHTDRRGRAEAKVHEVIEHVNTHVAGRFFLEHDLGFLVPDSKRLTQNILVPKEFSAGAKNGQMVLGEIVSFPSKQNQALARITRILGDHMAPGMETVMAIQAYGIPEDWSEEVLHAVSQIPKEVDAKDCVGRCDLRALPFVTIDGEDAKDFDDAVYCYQKPKGGYQLYVAIADVSHYVPIGSALDKEAEARGNSVYFPGKVVPMLPEALSNGICSLNPKLDRLCMVAEIAIAADGKIGRSRFYRAVFHSQARLTYSKVGLWLKEGQAPPEYAKIWPMISDLYQLYKLLLQGRKQRGAMDFETTETSIQFDTNHKIKRIVPVQRNDAHRLIEECMLAANVAVAKFISSSKIPALYRVHAVPDENKIASLREFLAGFGLTLGGGKKPEPKDYQSTLACVGDRPERHLIETVMLRSLRQAQYLEENDGHFGLAYHAYTHFTSPIRRYPDLLIHRALGHLMDIQTTQGNLDEISNEYPNFPYNKEDMGRLSKHCSMTERRADDATRDVVLWLKCEYMQDKLGQVFEGTISSVTSFGIFVELKDIYVEGLVHVTSLKNDYYSFDAGKHRLLGERTGQIYRLGDSVTVLVARVDLDERKIDFELVEKE